MSPKIIAIVAMDKSRLIGSGGKLPWNIPEDMAYFRKCTMGHAVLMGRKTYQSIPKKFRPLSGRKNIVVTRDPESLAGEEGIEICTDPVEYLEDFKAGRTLLQTEKLWIIGGANIYSLTLPCWDELYLTLVHGDYTGDVYLPRFEEQFELVEEDKREKCTFLRYQRFS